MWALAPCEHELSIRQVLDDAHSAAIAGSLRMQTLTDFGVGVLASLAITHYGQEETYFDEELQMPSAEGGSNILRAVGDDGGSSIVAITSLSGMETQHVSVNSVEESSHFSNTLTLLPSQTLVIHPCTAQQKKPTFDGNTATVRTRCCTIWQGYVIPALG
jgi:hypothetical protein